MGAQDGGVTDGLQREGMVGHAGHDIEVGDVAAGEDDVVVIERARLAVVALELEAAGGEVDAPDLLRAALDARQELAEGNRSHRPGSARSRRRRPAAG